MAKASPYAANSWSALGRFLDDPALSLDHNASEAALRRVALDRKGDLFVGDVDSGDNIGVLCPKPAASTRSLPSVMSSSDSIAARRRPAAFSLAATT